MYVRLVRPSVAPAVASAKAAAPASPSHAADNEQLQLSPLSMARDRRQNAMQAVETEAIKTGL